MNYETPDPDPWPDPVRIPGLVCGVAWNVMGWQTEPTEDTWWDGIEERTGRLVVVMVGDDRHFLADPDDLEPLAREEYCGGCGQIGCGWC